MTMSYFDIENDKAIINDGGFFCQACLIGKTQMENSPDPRYCLTCYDFLLKEADMDTSRRNSDWKPIISPEDTAHIPDHVRGIMSISNDQEISMDIIQPEGSKTTRKERGSKKRELPEQYIKRLFEQGLGSRAIATRLNKEQGIDGSAMCHTILSGFHLRRNHVLLFVLESECAYQAVVSC